MSDTVREELSKKLQGGDAGPFLARYQQKYQAIQEEDPELAELQEEREQLAAQVPEDLQQVVAEYPLDGRGSAAMLALKISHFAGDAGIDAKPLYRVMQEIEDRLQEYLSRLPERPDGIHLMDQMLPARLRKSEEEEGG